MTIPDRPLELDIETRKFTLAEMAIFDTEEAEDNPVHWLNLVRKFLIARSVSWTREEINSLDTDDLQTVGEQVAAAVQRTAVPLASSPPSRTGPGTSPKRSHPGRSKSPTPRSLASSRAKSASE